MHPESNPSARVVIQVRDELGLDDFVRGMRFQPVKGFHPVKALKPEKGLIFTKHTFFLTRTRDSLYCSAQVATSPVIR